MWSGQPSHRSVLKGTRGVIFKPPSVAKVVVYASSPVQKVIDEFEMNLKPPQSYLYL